MEIAHGDIFDLGDVHVEIVYTPGHTRGMCMALIQEERTILFDDGCGVSVMLLDEYSTSVEEYLDVLKHLKKKEESHDYIIRNHGTFVSPKELLDKEEVAVRRYPVYVTIDANIFDATGYDLGDDGTLGHLYSYVQSRKIKIVLSNIVIREAQKHIKEKAYEIATLSKKMRDEIRSNKLYSDNFVIGVEMGHVPGSRLQYFGLAICGAKKKVNKLTGSMPKASRGRMPRHS